MKVNTTSLLHTIFIFFFVFILYLNTNYESVYSYLGILLFLYVALDFFRSLSKSIPVKQLMVLIALLQWVIAPLLSYHYFTDSQFYGMQVPEEQYMGYTVPAVFAFYIGLSLLFKPSNANRNLSELIYKAKEDNVLKQRGYFLYGLGFLGIALQGFTPAVLSFAVFLLAKVLYVGAFYLLASNVQYKYLYLLVAFIPLVLGAQGSTVFHDLFLWGGFIFMVYALINQIGFLKKFLFIALGVFLVFFVQFIKGDYREVVQAASTEVGTETIIQVAETRLETEGVTDNFYQSVVDRLNQGWIIARIIYVVPAFEPYAEGETITEGIKAAVVPRFLNPNKVVSGGAYFERFTKIKLQGTSMNLGLLGEAYANYGASGGILFMFVMGLFFKWAFNIINRISIRNYEVILWLPFLFLYVVKAEDDFTTMLNQFTKAALVCWIMFYLMNKLYPKRVGILTLESAD